MKVLMVSDCGLKYGASRSFRRLVYNISKIDKDIKILVLLSTDAKVIADEIAGYGCEVIIAPFFQYLQDIPYSKSMIVPKFILRGAKYMLGRILGTKLAEERIDFSEIDLIYSNSIREDIGALLSKKFAIPHIWHIREFGELDFNIYSYRHNYVDYIDKNSTRCLAVSEAVRQYWIKKGIRAEHIYTVYNGVRINENYKITIPEKADEKIRIIMVGSLIETKGHLEMIEAISFLPDSYKKRIIVDIYGDGKKKYVNELRKKIAFYGLGEIIKLRGYLNDVSDQLCNYDIGLTCSKSEAFGRVTAEYMMAGLAVIASDTGANSEIIENGISGVLYEQGRPMELANAIQNLIDNPKILQMYASNGRKDATKQYDELLNANNIINQYYEVLEM